MNLALSEPREQEKSNGSTCSGQSWGSQSLCALSPELCALSPVP